MVRILVVAVLAALVIQVWGIVYWVASPLPHRFLRALPEQERVIGVLSDAVPATGVYRFPFPAEDSEAAVEAFMARHREGPIGTVFFREEGSDPMSLMTFVRGFLHNVLSALLVTVLMLLAGPGLGTYGRRVVFVALVGTFAAVAVGLSPPIWLQHPWAYETFNSFYVATSWTLAGLVMAKLIRATP